MILGGLFSAIAFLTVIPIRDSWKSRKKNQMFAAYPAAGLLIGAVLSALYLGADYLFPSPVAVLVVVAATVFLTGGMHLDGLADCSDALYGKRDKETTLRIMKDPRIGAMGGCAIGLALLARYASLSSLPSRMVLVGLPMATMLSRTAVIAALRVLPYVRHQDGILPAATRTSARALTIAAAVLLVLAALLPVPTLAAALSLGLLWRMSWKRIGGCTGDVLGAGIEMAEISFLIACTAMVRHRLAIGLLPLLLRWGT